MDTQAPAVTPGARPPDSTTDPDAHFELGSNEQVTYQCSLDGGEYVTCGPTVHYPGLGRGPHVLEVRATDSAGNVTTERFEWEVTGPPPGFYAGGGCSCAAVEPSGMLTALALLVLGLGRRRRRGRLG